ncbi:hypothetical protein AURDEDRAFT_179273 [Auricularia subglabra TFB-10046 SS5]|nr:hypothetical protein AURDEDRAFT_179273 [Auricularia subglabra TFB-10046 SS5]
MGFLSATRLLKTSRVLKAPLPEALQALHDPQTLIRLNPLVIDCSQDDTDKAVWHITDRLSIAFITTTTKYTVRFTPVEDGVDCESSASGVHILNRWRARALDDEGQVEVSEEAKVETSIFLIGYVEGQLKTSHVQLLEAMASLLEGKGNTTSAAEPER